jgi:hypothetical protein
MKTTHLFIMVGNANYIGIHILEDIKNRLNERYLNGSTTKIIDIKVHSLTHIRIELEWSIDFDEDSNVFNLTNKYILGLVSGILIWSGVEVD